jgi:hypothetical protein
MLSLGAEVHTEAPLLGAPPLLSATASLVAVQHHAATALLALTPRERPTESLPAPWAGIAMGRAWHCATRSCQRSASKSCKCCAIGPQADSARWHLIYFSIFRLYSNPCKFKDLCRIHLNSENYETNFIG